MEMHAVFMNIKKGSFISSSSIYILHYMDFDMNDVPPMIFFRSDIQRVRVNTAYGLLRGSFQL
jgi:hypothetical protein